MLKAYLKKKKLKIEFMGRGSAWLDTGNPDSLFETSQFIANIEKRQGLKIACLEEIAYEMGYSSTQHLSQQFKKVTGLTPSHFKQLKENKRKPLDKITE